MTNATQKYGSKGRALFLLISWLCARLRWSILEFSVLGARYTQPRPNINRIRQDREQHVPPNKWVYDHARLYYLQINNSPNLELTVREFSQPVWN